MKQLDKGSQFLSSLVHYRTYAANKQDGTKETKEEMFRRVEAMHLKKYPLLDYEIKESFDSVIEGLALPSMRSCQFGGHAIERENTRIYNCSFLAMDSIRSFGELFFILCCGTGVGYAVHDIHIRQLPVITVGYDALYVIPDSKEGWADSIIKLLQNPQVKFEYDLIRPEGALLSTGGNASGSAPLKHAHEKIRNILFNARNRKLNSVECSDIVCLIADCVVVGSVRRSATICLFDWFDEDMLNYKRGEWYIHTPWRARANISASIYRKDPLAKKAFNKVLDSCFDNGSGEPGIIWTNDPINQYGFNPCAEASLRNKEFCNLTSTNVAACTNLETFLRAVKAATVIGTLQAGYDNLGYLRQEWKQNLNETRLLGVSMTGIAEVWDMLTPEFLQAGADQINKSNTEIAAKIGINTAARKGCVKPEGTSSAALGVSSGITAHKDDFFWRRVRMDKSHPLSIYLQMTLPAQFLEQDAMNPKNIVVNVPIAKPGSLTTARESAIELLEREKRIYQNWIMPSHSSGTNTHNVSITVNYKECEKKDIKDWMWANRQYYAGIALFPENPTIYPQLPFESMTEQKYNEVIKDFPEVNLGVVNYQEVQDDDRKHEAACGGGACEWGIS